MLRLENISKTYSDGVEALKNISFNVEKGEFIAVLGQSGSGKSTLMRCINRLVEPTSGKIFLDGQEITGADARQLRVLRRKIGMVFQDYNLVKRSSAIANALAGCLGRVSPWASLFGHFPRDEKERAQEKFMRMGLGHKTFQQAGFLSGGQQQRVGIARALMQNPAIILADEPVSSLDPAAARSIMETLRDVNKRDGVTIICNLHMPQLAKEFGRRIIGLNRGRIVFDGPPENYKDDQAIYGTAVSQ